MTKQKQMEMILIILRDSKDYINARELSESLHCSEKTVYRLVKTINGSHSEHPLILAVKGRGFKLNPNSSLIDVNENYNYTEVFDPETRREKLLECLLLTAPKPYPIYELEEKFCIGESVILKDRHIIQERLEGYDLTLRMRQRMLFIEGEESDIRLAIINLLPIFSKLDLEQITNNKNQPLEEDLVQFCLELLVDLERELGVKIPYPYNINIFSHLYIFISRNRRSSANVVENSNPSVLDENIFVACSRVIKKIEQRFNISVNSVEVNYLYQYVVSSRLQKTNSAPILPFSQRVIQITSYYFKKMCREGQSNISSSDSDFIDLASHISPLLRRIDNGIQVKNNLLSQIVLTYPDLMEQLTSISKEVSLKFQLAPFSQDEIGFLALYFARFQEHSFIPLKTVVMCTSGVGTSELLRTRLEHRFPELNIIDVVAYRQLDELSDLYPDLDLIITTVALQETVTIPFVLVSSLLTEGDKQRIRSKIQEISYE